MTSIDDGFQRRGSVNVTPAALAFARKFADTIGQRQGGPQIVTFHWAMSIIEQTPGQPDIELGPCLTIGVYRRNEVPIEARDFLGELEFAIHIPDDVLAPSVSRLIDIDDRKPFNLTLR